MNAIAVDGLNEEAFRRSIEGRLRQGLATEAVGKLRKLLAPYAGPDGILPERFLTVDVSELRLVGWERLGEQVARHDRDGWPITAVSIAFGWPGEEVPQPDAEGRLNPLIETAYYSDEAFPFSQSARDDLLDGYSYHGCTWADDCVSSDHDLKLEGIDDLHGALAALEARLLASEEPDEEEIRAGSLGACLLSALLFKAVEAQIARDGLPRPLCVLSGSNGVYPYFDAPVAGMPADALKAEEEDEVELSQVPGPRYSSLLVTGIPRARKRAVLVLDETDAEKAMRTADLRNLSQGADTAAAETVQPPIEPEAPAMPDLSEAGIAPAPHGPLVSKSPAKKAWDFRDMLGPKDGEDDCSPADLSSDRPAEQAEAAEPGYPELPPLGLEPEPEMDPDVTLRPAAQFDDLAAASAPEPVPPAAWHDEFAQTAEPGQPPAPIEVPVARFPRLPAKALPEPGFALLDESVQARLDALVADPAGAHATGEQTWVEPELAEIAAPTMAETGSSPVVPDPAPPAGPAWPLGLGWLEEIEAAPPAEPAAVDTPRPGLLARLRRWWRGE